MFGLIVFGVCIYIAYRIGYKKGRESNTRSIRDVN